MSQNSKSSPVTWKRKSGYIWSLLGSAIGFANVISFSAMCYRNGGGAFLLPFSIAMLVLGWPMLCLEALIGQQWKLPLVSAYGKVLGQRGKSLGWLAVLACVTIGGFYIVLTGYTVAYMGFSASGMVPADTAHFFRDDFLHLTSNVTEFGTYAWSACLATVAAVLMTAVVMLRGIQQGIEKVCSIFLPFLCVIVVVFAIAGSMLPGAMVGWREFLVPDLSRLADIHLWRDVFGHLFFSFSLGLGIVVGYSRYTGDDVDVAGAMRWVAFGDFAISFIAGLAVFGCIGFMSHSTGTPFHEIIRSDSTFEIGFVVFPTLLQLFGPLLARVFGAIFFFCLFVAGITGVFSIAEAIAGNIEIEFRKPRRTAIAITLSMMTVLSFIFCMGNGLHVVDAIAPMVMGSNMLIGGLVQIAVFGWLSRKLKKHPLWQKDTHAQISQWLLLAVAPVILGVILVGNIYADWVASDIASAIRWGWFVAAAGVAVVLPQLSKRSVQVWDTESPLRQEIEPQITG